jgi:hypothetical protein
LDELLSRCGVHCFLSSISNDTIAKILNTIFVNPFYANLH